MSNQADRMYAQSLGQIATALEIGGHLRTMFIQGHMGTGKSSLLKTLAERKPDYHACYFDCTTKDLGDIMIPLLKDVEGSDFVRFATNEELGLHLRDKPVILMLDEFGKANRAVQQALTCLILERKIGPYEMHPDSILFATSNLGAEGVGDLMAAHACNRLTMVTVRKPDHMEWIEWAINNDIDVSLLAWVRETPQLFHTFEDIPDKPDQNPYIYHPKATGRTSFVTPRSLEAASDWLKLRDRVKDRDTITAMLMGTIGRQAAMDLMAFVDIGDQLPTLESIKTKPKTAVVPKSAAACCMVVYRTLANIDEEWREKGWIDQWMDYLVRMDKESQGLFCNGAMTSGYRSHVHVAVNKKFGEWARENNYLYTADV
jgi:hypothetical protein